MSAKEKQELTEAQQYYIGLFERWQKMSKDEVIKTENPELWNKLQELDLPNIIIFITEFDVYDVYFEEINGDEENILDVDLFEIILQLVDLDNSYCVSVDYIPFCDYEFTENKLMLFRKLYLSKKITYTKWGDYTTAPLDNILSELENQKLIDELESQKDIHKIDPVIVYKDIFANFESEFLTIAQYVAMTQSNRSKVYSNKIHELHLRVCSEVENVLKQLKLKLDPSLSLEKSKSVSYYLNLFQDKIQDLELYFKINIEQNNEIIKPFPKWQHEEVPKWWTRYNNLKHDKIRHYKECTLEDLVNSFGALYILISLLSNNLSIKSKIYKIINLNLT